MKKIFLAAIAATTLFASCAKENNDTTFVEEQAQLTVGIGNVTRATGQLTDNSDNAIGCFKAFVFAGDRLQAIMTSANGAAITETTKVTTAATEVYVIANANTNSTLNGVIEGTTNKTTFLALMGELLNASNTLNIVENGKVWASGKGTLTSASFTGTNNEATLAVTVVPVGVRINVEVDDQRLNKAHANAYKLNKVKVLNVVGKAPFIAGTFTPATWFTGYTGGKNAAAAVKTYFDDTYSAGGHLFYAFENDATAYPTIVAIETSNGTKTRYYSVHFTAEDAKTVLTRGKSYQVAMKLTGDALDDTDITDPEEPIVTAKLTVSVTPTNWVMVSVPKEF